MIAADNDRSLVLPEIEDAAPRLDSPHKIFFNGLVAIRDCSVCNDKNGSVYHQSNAQRMIGVRAAATSSGRPIVVVTGAL